MAMQSLTAIQSKAGSVFTAYASMAATIMLVRSMINDVTYIIPTSVAARIRSFLSRLFRPSPPPKPITVVIDEQSGLSRNLLYDSAESYLGTKISPVAERFKVNKTAANQAAFITADKDQLITDTFRDGIHLEWRFFQIDPEDGLSRSLARRFYELSFQLQHRETVVGEYLPFVMEKADALKHRDAAVKLYTRDGGGYCKSGWGVVDLDHPSTFETLAMEPEMKRDLILDMERFLRRKDYYRRVGKAWKRGYLLYGPPGTGKSSLIAAMANYLKFDIYDFELTKLSSNSNLRSMMMTTTNRSIIVIEDIDCSTRMHDRDLDSSDSDYPVHNTELTLSGMLNFMDGLWSCLGEERIIVFTTNHKEKLDPALLRPGRMDMHIHMSYCTAAGFRILASNYLGIGRDYDETTFDEIERLIGRCNVAPAELAEELMRSEDAGAALQGVISLLNNKVVMKDVVVQVKDGDDDHVLSGNSTPVKNALEF